MARPPSTHSSTVRIPPAAASPMASTTPAAPRLRGTSTGRARMNRITSPTMHHVFFFVPFEDICVSFESLIRFSSVSL